MNFVLKLMRSQDTLGNSYAQNCYHCNNLVIILRTPIETISSLVTAPFKVGDGNLFNMVIVIMFKCLTCLVCGHYK